MRLKVVPEDFVVEETLVPPPADARGGYTIYRLEKRGVAALEAAQAIARALAVAPEDVGFAGLKDQRSLSTQLVSIRFGRGSAQVSGPLDLGRGLRLVPLHRAARPVRPEDNERNRFRIVVRDLDPAQAAGARAEAAAAAREGLPNYFDDQRFGGASPARGFVAERWAKGDLEGALALLVERPSPKDPRRDRLEKKKIAARLAAAKTPAARAAAWRALAREVEGEAAPIVRALGRDPGDLAGAFRALDGRFRALLVEQYQSFLWNEAAAAEVRAAVPAADRFEVMYRCGSFAFWRSGDPAGPGRPLGGRRIAFPTFALPKGLDVAAKPGERALDLRPEGLELGPDEADERFAGRRKVLVQMELARGAYATLVVKRILYALNSPRADNV